MRRVLSIAAITFIAVSTAFSQLNPSVTVAGTLAISEGGTARAKGLVELIRGNIEGGLNVNFSRGPILSVRLSRPDRFSSFSQLAFFEGNGVAEMLLGGRYTPVRGRVFVYVDDFGFQTPNMPDQIFIRFTTWYGQIIVRHGTIVTGDIAVVAE